MPSLKKLFEAVLTENEQTKLQTTLHKEGDGASLTTLVINYLHD